MQRKTVIRAFKYCIIVLVVLTVVMFALSLHTLISGIMGAISGIGESALKLNTDDPTGAWSLTFSGTPRNTAFLPENVGFSIGLLDGDGKYIAVDSTSVNIAAGEQKTFSLILTIPPEQVQKYNLNGTQVGDVTFELKFSIRTLGDLVGFTQTMKISAGGSL